MSFYTFRPSIFNSYIAASPAILWDDYYLQKNKSIDMRQDPLYVTLAAGGWDYEIELFKQLSRQLGDTNKKFKFTVNKNDSHATNGLRTLLDGLAYVYKM